MVNCNPETVSTDYDTSDRLYFEPLTLEHVLAVIEREQPEGVIVQLGGQTPLKLARGLAAAGVPIWGTSPDAIDLAEDRQRFGALLAEEGIRQPENGTARLARRGARGGAPASASRCWCGRATCSAAGPWRSATTRRRSPHYMREAAEVSPGPPGAPRPLPRGRLRVRPRPDRRRRAARWSAASSSTSRRRASTPATRRRCCRPTRSTPDDHRRDARHRAAPGAAARRASA